MTQELAAFDTTMNELRAAFGAADGKPDVQAQIRRDFEAVVREKDRYLINTLQAKAAALNALSVVLEQAIRTIETHIQNFPLGTLRSIFSGTPGGGQPNPPVVTPPIVAPPIVTPPGGGGTPAPVLTGPGVPISLTDTDFDALCRVAQSEVGHFAKHGADQLSGGLAAVVDTIINRVAHKGYADAVEGVVNQRFQFSAINPLGSWTKLPAARSDIAEIVGRHLRARVTGAQCTVSGATHFLNPHLSSANALREWGNHVVANAVAIFGDDAKKDVHFHGFAPGTALPRAYTLAFDGVSCAFSGDGRKAAGGTTQTGMKDRILAICHAEWAAFDEGNAKEGDDPQFRRVGDYWQSIGLPHNGRTQIVNASTGQSSNPPWSAAFISFVVRQAGGEDGFRYAQAHCHYVQDFISGRPDAVYEAMHPDSYAPQPGDIVHYGRGSAKQLDFSAARSTYLADTFYSSHSDFVISVDPSAGEGFTIGGNVRNSVFRKRIRLKSSGLLKQRSESGNSFPWIAVLRLIA